MAISILITCIFLLTLFCISVMLYKRVKQPAEPISLSLRIRLITSGFLAFIADTVGLGSFAVNVALAKIFGTFHDDELPAVNNSAQVIPGALEALFFLQIVAVDLTTLFTLVAGTCLGGLLGGTIVSKMSKQTIRLTMLYCFAGLIVLLLLHLLHLVPLGGELTALYSWKLVAGFCAMTVCGALTSAGIGLFVMVQGVLFLMNISPLVAFPIMTAAGAMQQPLTTLIFLKNDKVPLKKTLILSLSGCVAVLLTVQVFTQLNTTWLHSLLLVILLYNFYSIYTTWSKTRSTPAGKLVFPKTSGI